MTKAFEEDIRLSDLSVKSFEESDRLSKTDSRAKQNEARKKRRSQSRAKKIT